jgi:DNA-binding cell septation regulator SpoVG
MQIQKTEQEALQYCEETRILKNRIELGWLEFAKRLIIIKANNLAESQYGGFDLFLDEIRIKKATVDHMMRVYQKLCLDFGIPEDLVIQAGGYTRLYEILPLCKTKELAMEAIEHTKSLPSRESVKKHVQEAMTGQFQDCTHPESECFYVKVCKCCGAKMKALEIPSSSN